MRRIVYTEIFLLLLSVIAFGYMLGGEFATVRAELLPFSAGGKIDVTQESDGTYVDSAGNRYNWDGNALVLERSAQTSSVAVSSLPTSGGGVATSSAGPAGLSPGAQQVASAAALGGFGGQSSPAANALGPLSYLGSLLSGPLGESLIWGGVVFGVSSAVGPLIGLDKDAVEALSVAAGVGTFAAKMAQGFLQTDATTSLLVGAAVGFAVYYLLYEKVKYEAVEFTCLPWQAPVGASSNVCEQCNDPSLPCSEYRCRSLGQNCELVNAGTTEERCISVAPKDVVPPVITPNATALTAGYRYANVRTSPPGPGFEIVKSDSENGCVAPFTALRFGVSTDEPSQCKIDFNSTTSFNSMYAYLGNSNLFRYHHVEQFVLPRTRDFSNSSLELVNGKDLTFFIRCQDKNGNANEAEYALKLCVDPAPDTTPPEIKLTSVESNSCIAATQDSADIDFYVNEPSQCRWSRIDQSYELMEHSMDCDDSVFEMNALQLYTCRANLTGVTHDLTDYYVRCEDQQDLFVNDRNRNAQSYVFSLRGSTQLKLRNLLPNMSDVIYGGVNPTPVNLEVETLFGCDKGEAICSFSSTGEDGDFIRFANTNTEDGIHNQTLFLSGGTYDYHVQCVDSGGNLVGASTEFRVDIDTTSPIITRIYNDAAQLKVVTLRDSQCRYTNQGCDFLFEEGTVMPQDDSLVHFAPWDSSETYYIKCKDQYRDLTADCSAVVQPSTLDFSE